MLNACYKKVASYNCLKQTFHIELQLTSLLIACGSGNGDASLVVRFFMSKCAKEK